MDRIRKLIIDPWLRQHVKELEMAEKTRPFCRHGAEHMFSVARLMYLLMVESGDFSVLAGEMGRERAKEIIYAVALLHDIGRLDSYRGGGDHAQRGAEQAEGLLKKHGFDHAEVEQICTAIREHRNREADSMLGKYLYQADKLSRPCVWCEAFDECWQEEKDHYLNFSS